MPAMQDHTYLMLDVRPGEYLLLGGNVRVELVQKSGRVARLRVIAPRDVSVEKSKEHEVLKDATQRSAA